MILQFTYSDMKKFLSLYSAAYADFSTPRVAAIGVFDGVHPGHREIIRHAVRCSRELNAVPLAISFSPHPRQLFSPEQKFQLLQSESDRHAQLLAAGAKESAVINFDHTVANWEPEVFLENLADNGLFPIAGICVGKLWHFGRNGRGDTGLLEKFCSEKKWSFAAVEELLCDGEIISSSSLRQAVKTGDLDKFFRLCGQYPCLTGKVTGGMHIAGSVLNSPTANLDISGGILPPDGVYGAVVEFENRTAVAAVNIGLAPTFNVNTKRVEVHLLDFAGDLYGKNLKVFLRCFVRKEIKFDSAKALKNQIDKDIEFIRNNIISR